MGEETKAPKTARVFDPNCEHNTVNPHVIEFVVSDEEGNSRLHRLIQCNSCGQKIS